MFSASIRTASDTYTENYWKTGCVYVAAFLRVINGNPTSSVFVELLPENWGTSGKNPASGFIDLCMESSHSAFQVAAASRMAYRARSMRKVRPRSARRGWCRLGGSCRHLCFQLSAKRRHNHAWWNVFRAIQSLFCSSSIFSYIQPVRTIPLWKLRGQPLRNCSAGSGHWWVHSSSFRTNTCACIEMCCCFKRRHCRILIVFAHAH